MLYVFKYNDRLNSNCKEELLSAQWYYLLGT